MWVHADGVQKDVQSEVKEIMFVGASCLICSIFEDFEEFEDRLEYTVDLINDVSLTQRTVFAAETFLMVFDPAYSVPQRALHDAFIVEFLMHTLTHIAEEVERGDYTLREAIFPALSELVPSPEVLSSEEDLVSEWQEDFYWVAHDLIGEFDFEFGEMLKRLEGMQAPYVGRLFAGLNMKSPRYFDGYDSKYIEDNLNEIVRKCAKIIDFIHKYEKNGNFRPHP